MLDRVLSIESLKKMDLNELFNTGLRALHDKKTKLAGTDAFQFKKLILDELRMRMTEDKIPFLTIRISSGLGDPPRTNTIVLKGNQADTILQRCCYVRGPVKCVIEQRSGKIRFLEEEIKV